MSGSNITVSMTPEGRVRLEFDPTVELHSSSTGKSIIVAETRGNIPVYAGDKLVKIQLKAFTTL